MLIRRNSKSLILASLLIAMLCIIESCYNVSSRVWATFDSLKPGMSVTQVAAAIGSPDVVVGEITTAYGQRVVVWEYEKLTQTVPTEHTVYWVYVVDGKFYKHTIKGDWQKESQLIYKTDFSLSQHE